MAFGETGDGEDLSPEELREQLAAERAARESEREARQRAEEAIAAERARLDDWMRGGLQTARQQEAPLGPEPDPTTDFEAWQRWRAQKEARAQRELEARLERQREEITQRVTEESRVDLLWTRFHTKYPTYAAKTALVTAAYQALAQRKALPQSVEGIVDAVKAEMDAIVGQPLDGSRPPADRADNFASNARPLPSRKRAQPEDDAPQGMHESIVRQQRKYGLI